MTQRARPHERRGGDGCGAEELREVLEAATIRHYVQLAPLKLRVVIDTRLPENVDVLGDEGAEVGVLVDLLFGVLSYGHRHPALRVVADVVEVTHFASFHVVHSEGPWGAAVAQQKEFLFLLCLQEMIRCLSSLLAMKPALIDEELQKKLVLNQVISG